MGAQAFIDESGRGSNYYVCAAVVADEDADSLRRVARSLRLPGQRRWHFVHERDSRRRQILDVLHRSEQVTALVLYGRGHDAAVRADCIRGMIGPLIDRGVTRLVIESRAGRDHLDRQVLIGQLRGRGRGFSYHHLPPSGDPLLWVADAIAWCSSAGGRWRERIDPIVALTQDVSDC